MYVKGRLKTRKYTDKDGVEKYCTEILATEMQLLGGRDGGGSGGDDDNSSPAPARSAVPARGAPAASKPSTSPTKSSFDDMDDDIPF